MAAAAPPAPPSVGRSTSKTNCKGTSQYRVRCSWASGLTVRIRRSTAASLFLEKVVGERDKWACGDKGPYCFTYGQHHHNHNNNARTAPPLAGRPC